MRLPPTNLAGDNTDLEVVLGAKLEDHVSPVPGCVRGVEDLERTRNSRV